MLETVLFWVTLFIYVAVFCLNLFGYVGKKVKLINFSNYLLWGGFLTHTATCLTRWIISGHPPVTDTYELNLIGTWFTVLIFLLVGLAGKVDRPVGLVLVPISFLLLGYGYMSGVEIKPMGPAFQSPWLIVHVVFAWLAFGSYTIATGSSCILLAQKYRPSWTTGSKNRDPQQLDLSSYRFVILGFINHAIMLVSGSIWAKKLWGRYWSWDALETWSLIAFLFYAFYLHSRSFLGWKMEKAAWLTVAGLVVLAISFWGVGIFSPSPHPGP